MKNKIIEIDRKTIALDIKKAIFENLEESSADVDRYDYYHDKLKDKDYCICCDSYKENATGNICDKCFAEIK